MKDDNQNILLIMKVYGRNSNEFMEYISLCRQIRYEDARNYLDNLVEEILSRRTKLEKIISKISENSSNT